ncbi:hypothetical protein NCAS_0J00920 [Naumovozyma castellii]|uniref:Uncharacterized protein n=1 Tax=Naumovozyma castellii TaxID=27288 RepID=G0VKN4_NAUCA|nr:hypothetical protein NCAS_0J00920 [Naumovozyma castellii CBS 4309]CCC72071.1 hypothetical protein NCAS_0J00920 [Naumovozyma castellii CBS 4309]
MSGFVENTVLGFGKDYLQEQAQEYAAGHFQPVRDPYYTKDGDKEVKLRLPESLFSKKDRKHWKQLQNKAWMHDKSMCGCCCWTETIGWAPLLSILPVIGPVLMYWVHNKLIESADDKFHLSNDLKLKMHGNIILDLCISLVPILGVVFAWLHACSTRNCAMIYNFVVEREIKRQADEKRVQQERQQRSQPRSFQTNGTHFERAAMPTPPPTAYQSKQRRNR